MLTQPWMLNGIFNVTEYLIFSKKTLSEHYLMKIIMRLKEKKMEKVISAAIYIKKRKKSTKKGIWKKSIKSFFIRKKHILKQ